MIEIRPLDVASIDQALDVYKAILRPELPEHTTKEILAERLANGTGIFYVAVDTETMQIVGLKFGYIEGSGCIGRGIGVLPNYRRQGIATQLLHRFEADMVAHPTIDNYAFGSATTEGIPFHMASGYSPKVLIQFTDPTVRAKLDLTEFTIVHEAYNETYQTYQIYLELPEAAQNLATLHAMQNDFPEANVQFMFSKAV